MAAPSAPQTVLSVVIPVWNDSAALGRILHMLRALRGIDEIVVADASTNEECARIAEEHGTLLVRCAKPSRGVQMNAGARLARGDILLFQHADTELTQAHVDALLATVPESRIIGGAFHRKFDSRHQHLKWLESFARIWSRIGGSFYGDQSIFVRREEFTALGGYAEIPLMEDLEICGRLRKHGRTILLDPPIASSPRHAKRYGSWKTSIRNGTLITLFHLGVSPERLHRLYYRIPKHEKPSGSYSPAMSEVP